MDLEAPADAWYVWLGVALVSFAIMGVVLQLPSGPPPDANAAANAIDRAGGAPYNTTVTHDHDAELVRVDPHGRQLTLKNEHGEASASVAYDRIFVVIDHEGDGSIENVTHGAPLDEEFPIEVPDGTGGTETKEFDDWVEDRYEDEHETFWENNEWKGTNGRMVVRSFEYNGERYTFVDV